MTNSELKPDWLNEKLFSKIFQDELRIQSKDFRVVIKSFESASGHDDGSLLRVNVRLTKVNNETMENSLIVKYLQNSIDEEAFSREIAMYEEILPALEYEWKVRNAKITFAPKLYYTSNDPVKLLVIEWIPVKTSHELDLNHCKVLLEKLSQYHATTAVYFDKYTTYGESFVVDYTKQEEEFEANWSRVFPKFAELFEKHDSLKPYAAKIATWKDMAGGQLYNRTLKINKQALNVLNHGNFQTNNLLFSYNQHNEIADVLLINFQKSIFNSPVYDLLQFLVTSTSISLVDSGQIDDLIEIYHTNLVTCLKKLNYRMHVPNLDEFNMEILQKAFWGYYNIASLIELSLFGNPESESLTEDAIQRLKVLFKWFDHRGMLDI